MVERVLLVFAGVSVALLAWHPGLASALVAAVAIAAVVADRHLDGTKATAGLRRDVETLSARLKDAETNVIALRNQGVFRK